ncbi:MAG: hypothetical protein QMB65_10975 [Vicingaceae bacterium]
MIIKNILKKIKIKIIKQKKVKDNCNSTHKLVPNYKDTSWVEIRVTDDQLRIEVVLKEFDLKDKKILHVGIGSSSLASQFNYLAERIDGITVMPEEKKYAESLNLPKYNTFIINKYSNELNSLNQSYDFIIDNNLSSFACCKHHYQLMLNNYIDILNQGGMILTDEVGMKYYEDYAFGIEFEDLQKLEKELPVKVLKINQSVFAIQKLD